MENMHNVFPFVGDTGRVSHHKDQRTTTRPQSAKCRSLFVSQDRYMVGGGVLMTTCAIANGRRKPV